MNLTETINRMKGFPLLNTMRDTMEQVELIYIQNKVGLSNLETEGDLEDINKILDQENIKGESPAYYLVTIYNFIQACWGIISWEDLDRIDIPHIREFEKNYPALYKTMTVWAWG